MRLQQEARLLAAFRLLNEEERDILVDFAETRAAKADALRPKLRLVSSVSAPSSVAALSGAASKV